jgi:hypothetical protein
MMIPTMDRMDFLLALSSGEERKTRVGKRNKD